MTKTANQDVEKMLKIFNDYQQEITGNFVPWLSFLSMRESIRCDLITQQRNLHDNIKPVQVSGYLDNGQVVMGDTTSLQELQQSEENKKKIKTETDKLPMKYWLVNKFIYHHYCDYEGKHIFQYCYTP
jgi:hypothetical protein